MRAGGQNIMTTAMCVSVTEFIRSVVRYEPLKL